MGAPNNTTTITQRIHEKMTPSEMIEQHQFTQAMSSEMNNGNSHDKETSSEMNEQRQVTRENDVKRDD
jgi:hypothetical protein